MNLRQFGFFAPCGQFQVEELDSESLQVAVANSLAAWVDQPVFVVVLSFGRAC